MRAAWAASAPFSAEALSIWAATNLSTRLSHPSRSCSLSVSVVALSLDYTGVSEDSSKSGSRAGALGWL